MKTGCQDAISLLGPSQDGELALEDQGWVAEHIKGCGACRERQGLLAAQGQALRERMALASAQVDFSRFADKVMARVAADRAAHPSLLERLRALWWEAIRPHRFAFAGGGLAVAAAAALVLLVRPLSPAGDSAAGTDVAVASADRLQPQQAQIEELEIYGQEGTVLQLPGQATLIWIDDSPQVPSGRQQ